MKKIFTLVMVLSAMLTVSCQKESGISEREQSPANEQQILCQDPEYVYNEGPMVMGEKIEIPYSVSNLRKALQNVSPETRAAIPEESIVTTHYYVKFSPKDEAELSILKNNPKLILSEYPLDREVLVDGCSYHDPELPEDVPTYQYSTIEATYWKALSDTLSVVHEVLIEAFMPDYYDEEVETRLGQDIDPGALEELMAEAYRMTGQEYEPKTKAAKWFPNGRITAYDDLVGGQVPIKKVRVRGTHLLKVREGLTDDNGYYSFEHSFQSKASMKIVWESDRWDIRDGDIGQAYFNGPTIKGTWNVDIANDDSKALRYAAIHRAAWRVEYGNNGGLERPLVSGGANKKKIAYNHDKDKSFTGKYYCEIWLNVGPDIKIMGMSNGKRRTPSEIFETTSHEYGGHWVHYSNHANFPLTSNLIRESWACCAAYILTKQEYSELNVLNKLESPVILNVDGKVVELVTPKTYNRQMRIPGENNYTPIFIDFIDNSNQRLYYKGFGYDNYEQYPDDVIHDVPVTILQDIVLNNLGFGKIKDKLKDYARDNAAECAKYNMTGDTVKQIMDPYE